MNNIKGQEEADRRFEIIAPLINISDPAERRVVREALAKEHGISTKTISRYEKAFEDSRYLGLLPKERKGRIVKERPQNWDDVLKQACSLKQKVPTRSAKAIIQTLETEGLVKPGVLTRQTLDRHFQKMGVTKHDLTADTDEVPDMPTRYFKNHRMQLVQGDIKYGPYLPIGKNKALKATYLSSVIDHHAKFLPWSRFYSNQKTEIVEETLKQTILYYGKMDLLLFDNGGQYISKHIRSACAKLGIPIRNCKAYHAYTKGTIEKFHQIVDSFLAEVALEDVETLEELNALWEIYLEENYHTVPHSGLEEYYKHRGVYIPKEGITPEEEWKSDERPLEFLNADDVRDAFLHKETRKVRKDGFISFGGYKYFVSKSLRDQSVEIHFEQNLEKNEIPQTLTCFDSNNNKIEAKIMVADGDIDFEAFRKAEEEAKKRKEEKEEARKSNANGSRVLRATIKRHNEKKEAKAKNPALPEEVRQPIDPTGENKQTPEGVSKTMEAQQEPLEEREEGNGQGTQGEPAPLKLSFASYHLDDD